MTNRTFGVEIEFFGVTKEQVADALNRAGIDARVENYNHTTRSYWKLVYDASVNRAGTGCTRGGNEIVSPVLQGEEGLEELKLVVKVIKEVGGKVDKTCGIHVHHDASDLDLNGIKNVARLYTKYELIFDSLVPESRRKNNNRYCRSLTASELHSIETVQDLWDIFQGEHIISRYRKLNVQSLFKHQTIEFRQHSGSLNGNKIANWIKLTQRVVEKAKVARKVNPIKGEVTLKSQHRMYQRMKKELGIDEELNKELLKRMKELKNRQEAMAS